MDLDRLLFAVLVVDTGGLSLAVAVGGHDPVDAGEPVDELELIRPVENGSWVWPYTAVRAQYVTGRSPSTWSCPASQPWCVGS